MTTTTHMTTTITRMKQPRGIHIFSANLNLIFFWKPWLLINIFGFFYSFQMLNCINGDICYFILDIKYFEEKKFIWTLCLNSKLIFVNFSKCVNKMCFIIIMILDIINWTNKKDFNLPITICAVVMTTIQTTTVTRTTITWHLPRWRQTITIATRTMVTVMTTTTMMTVQRLFPIWWARFFKDLFHRLKFLENFSLFSDNSCAILLLCTIFIAFL